MYECNRCVVDFDCDSCVKSDVCPNKIKAAELIKQFSNAVCGYPFNASLTCWSYIDKSKLKEE
jgi:hypothetical protein